jgi:hypothetical protein
MSEGYCSVCCFPGDECTCDSEARQDMEEAEEEFLKENCRSGLKQEFELKFGPDGVIEGIYQDGLAELLDADIKEVKRASLVEWEGNGWAVRSAHDPTLALRLNTDPNKGPLGWFTASRSGEVYTFLTREKALEAEQAFFWELMERT